MILRYQDFFAMRLCIFQPWSRGGKKRGGLFLRREEPVTDTGEYALACKLHAPLPPGCVLGTGSCWALCSSDFTFLTLNCHPRWDETRPLAYPFKEPPGNHIPFERFVRNISICTVKDGIQSWMQESYIALNHTGFMNTNSTCCGAVFVPENPGTLGSSDYCHLHGCMCLCREVFTNIPGKIQEGRKEMFYPVSFR